MALIEQHLGAKHYILATGDKNAGGNCTNGGDSSLPNHYAYSRLASV